MRMLPSQPWFFIVTVYTGANEIVQGSSVPKGGVHKLAHTSKSQIRQKRLAKADLCILYNVQIILTQKGQHVLYRNISTKQHSLLSQTLSWPLMAQAYTS